jgi:Leucine-rich repeat (LRR) protein
MKAVLQKGMLWGIVALAGMGSAHSIHPGSEPVARTSISKEESQAAEALTKLGVPLQKDQKGVVRWIEATNKELTDQAMVYLPLLSRLEWLEIGGGKISPSGMEKLKGCKELRRLYIHDVDLAGDELAWLSGLSKLEALSLQRTGINGRILKHLASSESLEVLNLSGDDIADGDMEAIARLKRLDVLSIADTKITGTGIAKLEGMAGLNELNISNCNISDADLEYFLTMPNLRIVYARNCNLSSMAIQTIVARFPMLAIFRD